MTTFEQRLASVDLTPFKTNEFKTQPLELLLKQIYKYQKFKSKIILQKINRMNFGENTVARYINAVKQYLATGDSKSYRIGSRFYEILDNLKANHEAILTPSEREQGRAYIPRGRKQSHISPTPTRIVESPKYTEIIPDQYGVKIQNTIKLFANKEACNAYIECFKEFNKESQLELVKVEFEVQ